MTTVAVHGIVADWSITCLRRAAVFCAMPRARGTWPHGRGIVSGGGSPIEFLFNLLVVVLTRIFEPGNQGLDHGRERLSQA